MERESFEDPEVAALLNTHCVAIKVDREERPDIDHIYMEFCQVLTGAGGWPLTILMTPEKKPFFAGTYLSKNSRHGRTGLMEILAQVHELWSEKPNRLRQSAEEIYSAMQKRFQSSTLENPALQPDLGANNQDSEFRNQVENLLSAAYQQFSRTLDQQFGGFGHAPKFPSPHILGFLLRCANQPKKQAQAMVRKTLDGMAQGGIYDHIGYGFARYSTDEKWLVPHFEKMLYDNALLAYAYLEGYQALSDIKYLNIAREIFTYVLRDMTSPEGGFYSAEDADSEGVEGKFYLWTPDEINAVLGPARAETFMKYFDITLKGNYEGKNIPNTILSSTPSTETAAELEASRRLLFAAREKRVHPHKDDKILTAWNGLLIASLAKGFLITQDLTYIAAAEKAWAFIQTRLTRADGRLLARYRDGEANYLGYLNDYAYLIWGLLECYMATGQPKYLKATLELQNQQEELFSNESSGGYFLTGKDSEDLLFRPQEIYDGATPSGNSVSTLNLLRLARLTADTRWEDRADRQLRNFLPSVQSYPGGHTFFLQACQFALHASQELILAGPLRSPEQIKMTEVIANHFLPYATTIYQEGSIAQIAPWLKDYPIAANDYKCYYCEGFSCQQPVSTASELSHLLEHSAPI